LTVVEPVTDVCPRDLCSEARPPAKTRLRALASDLRVVAGHVLLPAELAEGLPPIGETWENFGAEPQVSPPVGTAGKRARRRLIKRVIALAHADDVQAGFVRATTALGRTDERPPLAFVHSTLPHAPWRYLPDGSIYPLRGRTYPRRAGPQWPIDQTWQRHILQTQYVDRLLGPLLRRLRTSGLYDRAVIVVTSDHGASFRANRDRRAVSAENLSEIAPVPFIVKYPRQRKGRISDRAVRTTDVLPTLAEAASVSIPWKTEGMPAERRSASPASPVDVTRAGRRGETKSLARLLLARKSRNAYEAQLLRHGLFALGPKPELVGRRVDDAPAAPGASATVDGAREYRDVSPGSGVLPALIAGAARGLATGTVVAVAVNGRIEATTRLLPRNGRLEYAAIVRPSSLRRGKNRLTVLAAGPTGLQVLATVN
jgi:hypothetical protein